VTRARPLPLLLSIALLAGCGSELAGPRGEVPGRAACLRQQEEEARRLGLPLEIEGLDGLRFVLVPRGEFVMGSPEGEPGRGEDEAGHFVRMITPYYIQRTEVTNAEFRAFRPAHASGVTAAGVPLDGDDQPAVNVTWLEAEEYAAWLTARDGRRRYRLPTEAEWEYACRAGSRTAFATGDVLPTSAASYAGGAPAATSAVASRDPNGWNLCDLHGNAAEWCRDWYAPYPSWALDSPQGPPRGEERVVRGGSWSAPAARARSAHRAHLPPGYRSPEVGFRVVAEVGYGDPEHGAHPLTFRTVDPSAEAGEVRDRPGYALRMISVVQRLTDRQIDLSPRWRTLEGETPLAMRMVPGKFYVYCWRVDGDKEIRGDEVKFVVPDDGPTIEVPVPLSDQHGSNRR
jgi:formylglycine-generating enzyme required for sulfatase activity